MLVPTVFIDSTQVYLINDFTESDTVLTSENTGYTDLNGISNFYLNSCKLDADVSYEFNSTSIDFKIVLCDGTKIRLYYDSLTKQFYLFSDNYERCYELSSYLNERKF